MPFAVAASVRERTRDDCAGVARTNLFGTWLEEGGMRAEKDRGRVAYWLPLGEIIKGKGERLEGGRQ